MHRLKRSSRSRRERLAARVLALGAALAGAAWAADRPAEDAVTKELAALRRDLQHLAEQLTSAREQSAGEAKARQAAEAKAAAAERERAALQGKLEATTQQYLDVARGAAEGAAQMAEMKDRLRAAERTARDAERLRTRAETEMKRASDEYLKLAESAAAWGAETADLKEKLKAAQKSTPALEAEALMWKRRAGYLENQLAQAGIAVEPVTSEKGRAPGAAGMGAQDPETARQLKAEMEQRSRLAQEEKSSMRMVQKALEQQVAQLEAELRRLRAERDAAEKE